MPHLLDHPEELEVQVLKVRAHHVPRAVDEILPANLALRVSGAVVVTWARGSVEGASEGAGGGRSAAQGCRAAADASAVQLARLASRLRVVGTAG